MASLRNLAITTLRLTIAASLRHPTTNYKRSRTSNDFAGALLTSCALSGRQLVCDRDCRHCVPGCVVWSARIPSSMPVAWPTSMR